MKSAKRADVNSSAKHVFDVLRTVSEDARPAGVSEISRRLALTGSSVFRALTTLEATGYVSRFRSLPQFELGTMPHLLNRALLNRFALNGASRPYLRALAAETGETVSLNMRLGWYSLRVCGIYGNQDIYHRDRLGELALLHGALAGNAILAFLPKHDWSALEGFIAETQETRPAQNFWDLLKEKLAAAVQAGFLLEDLPMSPGFSAIAMPVRDETGVAIASITINGPVHPTSDVGFLLAIRDRLENLIKTDPKRFIPPFAHIPASRIRLNVSKSKEAVLF